MTNVIIAAVLEWMRKGSQATAPQDPSGRRLLRYHVGYEIIGWSVGGLFLVFFLGTLLLAPRDIWHSCLPIFGGFSLMAGVLVWMRRRCTIVWSQESIRSSPLVGSSIDFLWTDITTASYSNVHQWWVLRLRNGRRFRVSSYMPGHEDFLAAVQERARITIPSGPG